MKSKKAAVDVSPTMLLIIVSLVLLFYGYYGYFYAPGSAGYGASPSCPFGTGPAFFPQKQQAPMGVMGSSVCAYSLLSFVLGLVILILIIINKYIKK